MFFVGRPGEEGFPQEKEKEKAKAKDSSIHTTDLEGAKAKEKAEEDVEPTWRLQVMKQRLGHMTLTA